MSDIVNIWKNALLQGFISKLFQKRNRLKIISYRPCGENGKKGSGPAEPKKITASSTFHSLQVLLPTLILQRSTACGGKAVQQIGTSVRFSGAIKM